MDGWTWMDVGEILCSGEMNDAYPVCSPLRLIALTFLNSKNVSKCIRSFSASSRRVWILRQWRRAEGRGIS